jgi:hypothetical protein
MRLINSIAGMLAALTLVPLVVPSADASTTVYTTKKVIYTTRKVVSTNYRRPARHYVAYRHRRSNIAYRTHTVYRTAYVEPVETTRTTRTVTRTVATTPTLMAVPANGTVAERRYFSPMPTAVVQPTTVIVPTGPRMISARPEYVMTPTSIKVKKHEIKIKETAVPVSEWY